MMEKVVFKHEPYEPWVTKQGEQLIYHLPVESGFASLLFTFVISDKHLSVLKTDNERYYFLFAVLHRRYQMKNPASAPKADRHFDLILLGDIPDVERLLNLEDTEGNGAVSNLIQSRMGRKEAPMRSGHWFKGQ